MRWAPRDALMLVTNRRALRPDARTVRDEIAALHAQLDEAIDAGIDAVQIREPDMEPRLLCEFVVATVARARTSKTRVLVNERSDIALAAGADGVHLTSRSAPASRIRDLLEDGTIGRSVHADDHRAVATATDYVLFGTVFETASKPAGVQAAGLDGLRAAIATFPVPVLGIGGMTPDRAGACRRIGAAGVASIGLFLPEGQTPVALGVRRATHALRAAMANLLE